MSAGQLFVAGLNAMATTRPGLATEFAREKNAPVTPESVYAGTARSSGGGASLVMNGRRPGTTGRALFFCAPSCQPKAHETIAASDPFGTPDGVVSSCCDALERLKTSHGHPTGRHHRASEFSKR